MEAHIYIMRLLFVRHGDPDYQNDSLTPDGDEEAKLLAASLQKEDITSFYVSPLGRAARTASFTLERMGRQAQVLDWLREFPAKLDVNGSAELVNAYPDTEMNEEGVYGSRIVWDQMPSAMSRHSEYYSQDGWESSEVAVRSDITEVYRYVTSSMDDLLAQHGYRREGRIYRCDQGNHDTLIFFAHLGIISVFLSHFWNVSPFVVWHGICLAPTSVTEVFTEEREKGYVSFRARRIGDISHLTDAGREPSFQARFCECYEDTDRRH